jgi:exosortase
LLLSKNLVGAGAWATAGLGFAVLYAPVSLRLIRDWATDDNYSHGFLIIPFALYFAWDQRARLASALVRPAASGLWVVGAGLALLVVGQLGAELFLARTSMIVVTVGAVAYLRGWQTVRVLAFPLAFLLLMVPIPAIIFNKLAFPLQLLASRVGESMLGLL